MRWSLLFLIFACASSCQTGGQNKDLPGLKIMTFNIHHARSASKKDTQVEIERYLLESFADFIFLQEVDKGTRRSFGRDQFALLQANAKYPYGHAEYTIPWDGGLYGIGLLSRHPLESVSIIAMEAPADQRGQDYEPRVAIVAKAVVDGRAVTLVATHLHYESPARETMAATLRSGLEPWINDQDALIFGGDLNLNPDEPLLATLTAGLTDTWTAAGQASRARIDYLFTRNTPALLEVNEDNNGLSDHPAYAIRIAWP